MNVYLVSKPKIDWAEWDRFVKDEDLPPSNTYFVNPAADSELVVEMAGRLCYMSYGKGRKTTSEFLNNIIKSEHYSVLEHANWTFIITGVSRSLTHELVRHRHFSFSQLSQRYVDQAEGKSVIPEPLEGTDLEARFYSFSQEARDHYRFVVEYLEKDLESSTSSRKFVRGLARAFLLESTETKIVVTGNARTWREFILKRGGPAADQEIRALAIEIHRRLEADAPALFSDLGRS